jgi:putative endonuclease
MYFACVDICVKMCLSMVTEAIFLNKENSMKPKGMYNYFVYIVANKNRKVLYTGVTNDLARRLIEHKEDSNTVKKHFAGRYNCFYLVFYERFNYINDAIAREKEIKEWKRDKKNALIS